MAAGAGLRARVAEIPERLRGGADSVKRALPEVAGKVKQKVRDRRRRRERPGDEVFVPTVPARTTQGEWFRTVRGEAGERPGWVLLSDEPVTWQFGPNQWHIIRGMRWPVIEWSVPERPSLLESVTVTAEGRAGETNDKHAAVEVQGLAGKVDITRQDGRVGVFWKADRRDLPCRYWDYGESGPEEGEPVFSGAGVHLLNPRHLGNRGIIRIAVPGRTGTDNQWYHLFEFAGVENEVGFQIRYVDTKKEPIQRE